jgi:hypothetical protein
MGKFDGNSRWGGGKALLSSLLKYPQSAKRLTISATQEISSQGGITVTASLDPSF